MNLMQIGRYKANADAQSQFFHFVGNISKQKTRPNHFTIKKFRQLT